VKTHKMNKLSALIYYTMHMIELLSLVRKLTAEICALIHNLYLIIISRCLSLFHCILLRSLFCSLAVLMSADEIFMTCLCSGSWSATVICYCRKMNWKKRSSQLLLEWHEISIRIFTSLTSGISLAICVSFLPTLSSCASWCSSESNGINICRE